MLCGPAPFSLRPPYSNTHRLMRLAKPQPLHVAGDNTNYSKRHNINIVKRIQSTPITLVCPAQPPSPPAPSPSPLTAGGECFRRGANIKETGFGQRGGGSPPFRGETFADAWSWALRSRRAAVTTIVFVYGAGHYYWSASGFRPSAGIPFEA